MNNLIFSAIFAIGMTQSDQLDQARKYAASAEWDRAADAWMHLSDKDEIQGEVWAFGEPTIRKEALKAFANIEIKGISKDFLERVGNLDTLNNRYPKDAKRREALADVLFFVASRTTSKSTKTEVAKILYLELPETVASKAAQDELWYKSALKRRFHLQKNKKGLALMRARILTRHHGNAEVVKTLRPFTPNPNQIKADDCEIRYHLGKAARKKRHYKTARKYLDVVAEKCASPWKVKAHFNSAQVAFYQGKAKAMPVLDEFLKNFPNDQSLSDDVLEWKAETLDQAGDWQGADKIYREIAERFPNGDVFDKARFFRAFLHAKRGDIPTAREQLEEIIKTANKPFIKDQARYWSGRLLLSPKLDSYDDNADEQKRAEGVELLKSLAEGRPFSYYGFMSRRLLEEKKIAINIEAAPRKKPRMHGIKKPSSLGKFYKAAVEQAQNGHKEMAVLFADQIDTRSLSYADVLRVASLYLRMSRPDLAHQTMRFSKNAIPKGSPDQSEILNLAWNLAYPIAYEDALTKAATEFGLSPRLMMGLAREESAFEASVVSWAGAIGLCQLMPFTAKEEAEFLKLDNPDIEKLREPHVNARLGTRHLWRRMKLGHPYLAIAAYNAGPGNVRKWRKKDSFKTLDAWVESIPVEQTRNYVKKVSGSWFVYEYLDGNINDVEINLLLP